jgi:copper homeostasis protein CutC
MQEEIAHARSLGADGVVLGLLDQQGRVDVPGHSNWSNWRALCRSPFTAPSI